jgi:lysine 6-dehydrogenase
MRFAVIGAGMQGTAAAYDMARFADAEEIRLFDRDLMLAQAASARINQLVDGPPRVSPHQLDATNEAAVRQALRGTAVTLSAAPYYLNLGLARAAVEAGSSFGDLGGNTEVVRRELELDALARERGVAILPDLGLAPGLGNTLAVLAMNTIATPRDVQIYCGGLPQAPRPPLGYKLVFSVEGLTNEYFGRAIVLRQGEVHEIETFSELERVEFADPIGSLEAFTTSGGTSTCPWSFADRLQNYGYKTLRYPGHFAQMKLLRDIGLLDLEPVSVDGSVVVPRALFHVLAKRVIDFPDDPDLVVLRVRCTGVDADRECCVTIDILDRQDEESGFTAMERMTAYPASIACIAMAERRVAPGAVPLEKALDAAWVYAQLPARGIHAQMRMEHDKGGE